LKVGRLKKTDRHLLSSGFRVPRGSFRFRQLDLILISVRPSFRLRLFAAAYVARAVATYLKRHGADGKLPINGCFGCPRTLQPHIPQITSRAGRLVNAFTGRVPIRIPNVRLRVTGHVSRAMMERYSHIRMEANRHAVNNLSGADFEPGVAQNWAQFFVSDKSEGANLLKRSGEPGRTRTYNPLLKRQLLYH
jgi:hypothetical protein